MASDPGPAPTRPSVLRWSGPPVRPETVCLLVGIALLLVFLALEPFLSYALFGSDTGEYYRLTADLVTTGHVPTGAAYGGWGTAYPDFPGIFLLAGAGSSVLGLDVFTALTVIIPVVAVLSVFPMFLLFRRIYPNDMVALMAAAFASVAMPRMFSIAHPAPLALGDFLVVAALWMLVEGRRDARWYLPLALTTGALIVTHHLSTYFFVVSAFGGILFLELWRPGLWSRRFPSREFVFLGGAVTATFLFWFYGTASFFSKVIQPALPHAPAAGIVFAVFEAAALGVLLLGALAIRWRRGRARSRKLYVRLPTDLSMIRDALLILAGTFGGVAILIFVPLPGTTQQTSAGAIVWFAPLVAAAVLASGSRYSSRPARLGPFALMWLGAIAASTIGAVIIGGSGTEGANLAAALPPGRHVEYLMIPLALLIAVGTARLLARLRDRAGQRAFLAGAVAFSVLLAANAAIVYPPQSDFAGFEEGLTHGDSGIWMWIGIAVPRTAVVATDHRLSSMVFGFNGNPATWDSTPVLFTGSNWSEARAELESANSPDTYRPVDIVAVDAVMYQGVALNPSAAALPLSAAAQAWFMTVPFVPIYANGLYVVYLVDSTEMPPP